MTQAVCFKCGEIKFGAFVACSHCGGAPVSDEDLVLLSLLAKTGSTLERDVIILRLIDQVITKMKIKRQSNPEHLFEALAARTSEAGFSFEEIQKVALRTKDEYFVAATTSQTSL